MDIETEINEHIEILLTKYNLKQLYNEFMFYSVISAIVRETFYLTLIFFSKFVQMYPQYIHLFSLILIVLLFINIPAKKYTNNIKSKFFTKVKLANIHYFNHRIINMPKSDLLNFDLINFYNILEDFNYNLEIYILNILNKTIIPIRCIPLLIISIDRNFGILIGLFFILFYIVKVLNDRKVLFESDLVKQFFNYKLIVKNYCVNSKNLLMNNEFNTKYINKNNVIVENINKNIIDMNDSMDVNINILIFLIIVIIIYYKYDNLTIKDFLYYFLVVYDVEHVSDRINEYYKNKSIYNKMHERLTILKEPKISKPINKVEYNITQIIINNIENKVPYIKLNKPLIINENDHILINGISGSGKTTLLYILKGIVKPEFINISPNLNLINSQTYITLPNHKSVYDGKLYDILSNYETNPNVNLIYYSLQVAKLNLSKENNLIKIDTLSSGERIRLIIARIIYTVITKNYNILLFDEIDENLNDILAVEIYENIHIIFKDKIILYITHNEKVKAKFKKIFTVKNGVIFN